MTAGKVTRIASGGLRITAIEIRNLWGIAEAVIRPGQRNIIRGANGTGKTSLLESVQLALGGGTLGKYQRLGADSEPQIVLEIEGPKDHIRIEREGDKPPKVLRRVGDSEALEKVSAPATFLKGLFDVRGSNPFAFLEASDDERAQLLLEALDLEMDEGALSELLGADAELAGDIPTSLHPLTRLALIHERIYSARRGCNVDAEGKAKAAEQLKRSVPHERILDATEEIIATEQHAIVEAERLARLEEAHDAELSAELQAALGECERAESELNAALASEAAERRARLDLWAAEKRAAVERDISAREREIVELTDSRRHEIDKVIKDLNAVARKRKQEAEALRESRRRDEAEVRSALASQRERLAGLRAQQAEVARHENTRAQIAAFESQAAEIEKKSARLSAKLKGLETLKRQLADALPIAGLEISGKEIKVNGVPWRDLNKAQQGAIAGIVAAERAKKSRLPIVFFDEAERFDQEHLDAVADAVEAAGAQLFAAVVAREGELTIEADGETTGSVVVDAPADPVVTR